MCIKRAKAKKEREYKIQKWKKKILIQKYVNICYVKNNLNFTKTTTTATNGFSVYSPINGIS